MQVEYGSYRHKVNSTGITISSEIEETEAGVPFRINNSINIEGRIQNVRGGRSRDFDAIINSMERAYSIPGQDFGLLHDNGIRSNAWWRNSQTLGGIRPKMLSYPNYKGGEYLTYRSFQITVNFQVPTASLRYIKFSESISIEGGNARYGVKEVNFGPGVRQQLRTHTKCIATQSGSATGRNGFPIIPPPIWPHALRDSRPKITKLIKPRGGVRTRNIVLEECEISWTYEYEWPFRLDGIPHYATG